MHLSFQNLASLTWKVPQLRNFSFYLSKNMVLPCYLWIAKAQLELIFWEDLKLNFDRRPWARFFFISFFDEAKSRTGRLVKFFLGIWNVVWSNTKTINNTRLISPFSPVADLQCQARVDHKRKIQFKLLQCILQCCCSVKMDCFLKSQGGPWARPTP
jgi:hypothetical protein